VRVVREVHRLLLVRRRCEVDRPIQPHRHKWRHVGSSVGPDSRNPRQLGCLENLMRYAHGVGPTPGSVAG
jgi:hypothetical protein